MLMFFQFRNQYDNDVTVWSPQVFTRFAPQTSGFTCSCERERERERESVCVCVCVRERERERVCVRERESV